MGGAACKPVNLHNGCFVFLGCRQLDKWQVLQSCHKATALLNIEELCSAVGYLRCPDQSLWPFWLWQVREETIKEVVSGYLAVFVVNPGFLTTSTSGFSVFALVRQDARTAWTTQATLRRI